MIQHRKHKLTAAILLTSQLSYAQSIIAIPNLSDGGSGNILSPVTAPIGQSLMPTINTLDITLDPLTNPIDAQIGVPLIDVASPVTTPVLKGLEPIVSPVDGILHDISGGSLSDALTNSDQNTDDGNGIANDLLGGGKNRDKTQSSATALRTGNPAEGNNGNDKPVGNAQGKKPKNKSPIESVSAPLGRSLTPLIDTVDESLDPISNVIDKQAAEPILSAAAPTIDPLLDALTPITHPVDGIVSDLSGGSLEDALTTQDYNDEDGQGPINDLLGNGRTQNSGREAGESSPLPIVTRPLGQALDTLVTDLDEGLDPLTDVVDSQLLAPVLDVVAPITEPILAAAEPLTDPVDGSLADLTGGSVEDALTNDDDNRSDGNGVANDLLGGKKNRNKTNNSETGFGTGNPAVGNNGNDKPVGNAQGKKPKNKSPIESVSAPLGRSLTPLIDTVDESLDPISNVIDKQAAEPILSAAAPTIDPLLDALTPITHPVDGIVSDLSGGSLEDALTTQDYNDEDGQGPINDLLGNGRTQNSGREAGESSPLPIVTRPLGQALDTLVTDLDEGLDPLTDVVDSQLLAPVLDVVAPITEPILAAAEPLTDPVDGSLADLTGGSVEDALTNDDDNRSDGNGVANDLLGGKKNRNKTNNSETGFGTGNPAVGNNGNDKPVGNAQGKKPKNKSPIESVSAPLGRSLTPLIDTVDESLDPITNVIDDEIAEPILSAGAPVIDPLLEGLTPITNPVDGIVSDLSGGSLEDALTTQDYNDEDGQGPINDLLGNGRTQNSGREAGESSPLPIVTRPLGQALDTLVTDLDEGLDPLTDVVDSQLLAPVLDVVAPITEPILAAAEPLTDPVDGSLADITGGSVEDALTNDDDNTTDGDGLVNDLLGGGGSAPAPQPAPGDSSGSPLAPVTVPLGEALAPVIDAVDTGLDPVTDTVDSEVGVPLLDALAPVTEPVVDGAEPVITPVDAIVNELTGGSVSDALSNSDANTADGDGLVNDLLGGGSSAPAPAPSNGSPLAPVTVPLGEALAPVIDAVDTGLDPVTDTVDSEVGVALLDALAPVTEPVVDGAEPIITPVDAIVNELTGGSVSDALTNSDANTADGDGLVNDLLGGGSAAPAPAPSDGSPLAPITVPLGEALAPVIDAVDTGLDPVTDVVDSQVGVPLLDALAPVTEPVVDGAEPIITPVDAIVNELTGGSVSDALTNSDANTADGDGLVNDLLGGGSAAPAPAPSDGSPLAPVTVPLGEALAPVIDALDTGLDPVTDTVDSEVGVPLLDALAPVTEPVIAGAEPIITPVDAVFGELTGGSVSDALTNSDANTADGDGLVNDLLGGGSAAPAPAPSDGSPLAPVTVPLGEALAPVIDALDAGLDPVTDTVDSEVGVPLLDALAPVTEPVITGAEPIITPVDAIVRELTGGSVSDALTNSDANTDDGDGVVNDLLGNRNANSGSSNPSPNDSDNDGIDDGASGEFNVVARQDQAGLTQSALDLAIATAATSEQCVDQDADGVCDQKDRCENTPKTSLVLEDGCDLGNIEPARLKGVNFSFDDDSLSPKAKATLDEAISLLQRSEYKTIEINGHTDHFGKQDYNLRLSQRRASNVKDYLIEHGIDANRIKIVDRGDQSLIAKIEDKDQAELNRRVDFTIIK